MPRFSISHCSLIGPTHPSLLTVKFLVKPMGSALLIKGFYMKTADEIVASARDIQ